ncbi:MAG: response regulator [Anaerolineales bacterium]
MVEQRIILIEDDNDMRSLITTLLEMEGYQVVSFDHIEPEAQILNQIVKQSPDLVMMDVLIKGKASFDLVRKLKQQRECGHTKILMSSGMAVEEECRKHGADGFILKPYMPDELVLKINQLLESA